MGLTGGVKSHRLSGQISPYCEKKRHWLCAYCAPMFSIANLTFRLRNEKHFLCFEEVIVESDGTLEWKKTIRGKKHT